MRASIKQRRQRMPAEVPYKPEEEVSTTGRNGIYADPSLPGSPPSEPVTGGNGVHAPTEPSLPVNPSPELVQAIVQLIQRVNQLEQVVGGMHQRDSVEIQKLKLKARCEALKRAIEVIPLDSPDAAARIEEVANLFLKWMNEPTPEEPPPQ